MSEQTGATDTDFDVIIAGGGPAGSSLGARLAQTSNLRVAIYESERFPREHIGESFASPVVPLLQEIGVLEKVLASDCWVQKFGGYYAWDADAPSAAFFRHQLWQQDGYRRWSLHVNRSEFDQILLEHARSCGVEVTEGLAVRRADPDGRHVLVHLGNGRAVTCRLFVDASGRQSVVNTGRNKRHLSGYRNIAVWNHFVGGLPAQSLPGEWNVFREPDLSPIGCFAFENGWCWYIPVPKMVNGRRILTHSIGIVTDPGVLRMEGQNYRDTEQFICTVRSIPLLRELTAAIEPISEGFLTATNYSMINARMCDFSERWMLIGDAAYFVDPLFSSGVSFALIHAAAAAVVIKATLEDTLPQRLQSELWTDYDELLSTTAHSFALGIDQWYAGIAHGNPHSIYWRERADAHSLCDRKSVFPMLLNGDFTAGDLLFVLTKGRGNLSDLQPEGGLMRAARSLMERDPSPGALIGLQPGVSVRESISLFPPPGGAAESLPPAHVYGRFWLDPAQTAGEVAPSFRDVYRCSRFTFPAGPAAGIKFFDEVDGGMELFARLQAGASSYEELQRTLSRHQWQLLLQLMLSDMLSVEESAVPAGR